MCVTHIPGRSRDCRQVAPSDSVKHNRAESQDISVRRVSAETYDAISASRASTAPASVPAASTTGHAAGPGPGSKVPPATIPAPPPSGGVVFTTIQKFLPDKGERAPLLSDRANIVVIADEAHRSQYDLIDGLARHLREACQVPLRPRNRRDGNS
jgi:hypothetical protein